MAIEGLELYGIFLEVMKKWDLDKDIIKHKPSETPFSDFLKDQVTVLEKIEKGEKVEEKEVDILKRFFSDLAGEFRKKIMAERYEDRSLEDSFLADIGGH